MSILRCDDFPRRGQPGKTTELIELDNAVVQRRSGAQRVDKYDNAVDQSPAAIEATRAATTKLMVCV